MSVLAAGLLLASTIRIPEITLNDTELATTYERTCAVAARPAECGWLQRELEVRLLADLQELQQLDEPIGRDVIRVAARAEFPFLALLGLQLMQKVEGPEDEAAVAWAMDHPSPAVRQLARQLARTSRSPKLEAQLSWASDSPVSSSLPDPLESDDWTAALMPEDPRSLVALGLPGYSTATYRPSLSDATLLVFTTSDRPERVTAVLAKGRTTWSGSELLEQTLVPDTDALDAITAQMEGVTDPQKLAELNEKMQEAIAQAVAPMMQNRIVRDAEGRYFELPAGGGQPRRLVGVGRDQALGLTTISVLLP